MSVAADVKIRLSVPDDAVERLLGGPDDGTYSYFQRARDAVGAAVAADTPTAIRDWGVGEEVTVEGEVVRS